MRGYKGRMTNSKCTGVAGSSLVFGTRHLSLTVQSHFIGSFLFLDRIVDPDSIILCTAAQVEDRFLPICELQLTFIAFQWRVCFLQYCHHEHCSTATINSLTVGVAESNPFRSLAQSELLMNVTW